MAYTGDSEPREARRRITEMSHQATNIHRSPEKDIKSVLKESVLKGV